MKSKLPFWQRLPITVGMMILASYLAGLVSQSVFGIPIPSYVAGAIGGLAAIPIWDFLKRIKPSQQK
jgi:UDP-N-acetylmuramyl pentapeptide phosphotransferase/UDP-N-acetylglucosamine-1-phosphate transferase